MVNAGVGITDTTFRDAHQSLLATRMTTADMEPIAAEMDQIGFHSMEVWGGATFDVATRYLNEDPWERLKTLKSIIVKTPLQMLLRGQNLVGYRHYPDDVVESFVNHSAELGIDIFRIFDALNDERNLIAATRAVKDAGKHAQLCICYSMTEEGPLSGPVFTLEYFLNKAKSLCNLGADSICIKDMAGILTPFAATTLVTALKKELSVPIQLHTHYTSGLASMTTLKAIEAGIDTVDACLAPFAYRTAQPAVEPLVTTLEGTQWATGLNVADLSKLGDYLETLSVKLRPYMANDKLSIIDVSTLAHQIPGGMVSNLFMQLKEMDAIDLLPQVLEDVQITRKELGYPPLVTPTSQMVGSQSVNNVMFGRWSRITTQVKDYAVGLYGQPPVPMDPALRPTILKSHDQTPIPIDIRPADLLTPGLDIARTEIGYLAKTTGDLLIAALYPVSGKQFLEIKYGLSDADIDPTNIETNSKSGPESHSQTLSSLDDIELSYLERHPEHPQSRRFSVTLAGSQFEVLVTPWDSVGDTSKPQTYAPKPTDRRISSPTPIPTSRVQPRTGQRLSSQGQVPAPMPGVLLRFVKNIGDHVEAGDTVAILEAMKMENEIPSDINGTVGSLQIKPGDNVARGDILFIINPG